VAGLGGVFKATKNLKGGAVMRVRRIRELDIYGLFVKDIVLLYDETIKNFLSVSGDILILKGIRIEPIKHIPLLEDYSNANTTKNFYLLLDSNNKGVITSGAKKVVVKEKETETYKGIRILLYKGTEIYQTNINNTLKLYFKDRVVFV
jgi:hypothetical protein